MARRILTTALGIILASYCLLLRAQRVNDSQPGCSASTTPNNLESQIQIVFDSVEFSAQSDVPREIQKQLVDAVDQLHEFVNSDSSPDVPWLDDVKESVRLASQNLGYFRVLVDATAGLVRAEPHRLHYWISVDAKLGRNFVLGDMHFSNAPEFSEAVLRKEFDLQRGDVFNVSKIRRGIQRITALYGNRGYIDMTAEPEFTIHDDDSGIDLGFDINQGSQYRIKSVEIRGLDRASENALLSNLQAGQVFDRAVLNEFYKTHPDVVPSENVRFWRDVHNSTIEIVMDAQACKTKNEVTRERD
jgi:outer membrane protein assembly factor BamA